MTVCNLCASGYCGEYIKTPEGKIYEINCIRQYHAGRKTPEEIEEIIGDLKQESYNYKVNKKLKEIHQMTITKMINTYAIEEKYGKQDYE